MVLKVSAGQLHSMMLSRVRENCLLRVRWLAKGLNGSTSLMLYCPYTGLERLALVRLTRKIDESQPFLLLAIFFPTKQACYVCSVLQSKDCTIQLGSYSMRDIKPLKTSSSIDLIRCTTTLSSKFWFAKVPFHSNILHS